MMEIDVIIRETYSIQGKVNIILFEGTAKSEFFSGTILPGGVDTQRIDKDGNWSLSARYMLEGTDDRGTATKLFIQNEGREIDGKIHTTPMLLTDNERLKWVETTKWSGVLSDIPKGVRITITKDA